VLLQRLHILHFQDRPMTPEISVVIPAYNRFATLVPVVESILAQTVPVLEIIIVDDGSTDETAVELPRYVAERPGWTGRVRCFRQENQGQSAAVNRGISSARGDWLAFAAHDDLWLPWKLEWQLRALERYDGECGLCFTDAWFMNNPYMKQTVFAFAGAELPGPFGILREPLDTVVDTPHPIWVQTVLARADVVRQAGNLDPFLRYSEDHDFLFRMGLLTPFCYVSMPMVMIDRSPARIRHVGHGENWNRAEYCLRMDQYRFEKQLRLAAELPAPLNRRIRRNLRATHSHWANLHLAQHQYAEARSSARTALQYQKTLPGIFKWLLISTMPWLASQASVARDRRAPERLDRTSWETAGVRAR
jgi:glycosyltransferase involved in cell wall biosynthesis